MQDLVQEPVTNVARKIWRCPTSKTRSDGKSSLLIHLELKEICVFPKVSDRFNHRNI